MTMSITNVRNMHPLAVASQEVDGPKNHTNSHHIMKSQDATLAVMVTPMHVPHESHQNNRRPSRQRQPPVGAATPAIRIGGGLL